MITIVGGDIPSRVQAHINKCQLEVLTLWRTLYDASILSILKGPSKDTVYLPLRDNKVAHWINVMLQGIVLGIKRIRYPYIVSSDLEYMVYMYQSSHYMYNSFLFSLSSRCLDKKTHT